MRNVKNNTRNAKNRSASIDIGLNNLATFSCRRQPKLLI
ncbi:hypothetical protein, partial [Hydrocoleum sp. CS-953]